MKYENKVCGTCAFREENGKCRKAPPALIAIPGAPPGTIIPPGARPMMLNTAYPVVPPNYPACSYHAESTRKLLHGTTGN